MDEGLTAEMRSAVAGFRNGCAPTSPASSNPPANSRSDSVATSSSAPGLQRDQRQEVQQGNREHADRFANRGPRADTWFIGAGAASIRTARAAPSHRASAASAIDDAGPIDAPCWPGPPAIDTENGLADTHQET